MIIYSKWLKNYIDLPKKLEPVLDQLTQCGLEVEAMHQRDCDTTYLRIGHILESTKHPNADRLSLCNVKTKEGVHKVVCGAKNYVKGDKVVLALPGAKLAKGLKIRASKIRGEESHGMLCSEEELGFQPEAQGILILPSETSLQSDIKKALGLGELVFELNVTPNRPDCLSFLGVARELRALTNKPLKFPKIKIKESKTKIKSQVSVKLQDSKKCLRYMGRLIEGVKIGPSPAWLAEYLTAVGQRSINNVVDITNFVLLEFGQPLHAFDFDKIENQTVIIRSAKKAEKMTTLDGQQHELTSNDLVIADSKKPIALAGVMGGATSEVSNETKNIFLESAYFNPTTTRRTSKRLGLSSESSKRFERGVDMAGVYFAMERATQLISEIAGGRVAKGWVDQYPKKLKPIKVTLTKELLDQYLGYELKFSKAKATLQSLGFKPKAFSASKATFEVPSHRVDVSEEVDLIEEVSRLQGYDKIPTLEPQGNVNLTQKIEPSFVLEKSTKRILTSLGLTEVVYHSFCSPDDLKKIGWKGAVTRIQNPIGQDTSVMRPTLIASLLHGLSFNLRHQNQDVCVFELRNVYDDKGQQTKMLSGLLSGRREPLRWDSKEADMDFFDMKALIDSFLNQTNFKKNKIQKCASAVSYLHPGWSAEVVVDGQCCGVMGKLHPQVQDDFQLKQDAYVFELDFSLLNKCFLDTQSYQPLAKFPAIRRDISLVISEKVNYGKIKQVIEKEAGAYLKNVELFDIYQGKQVAEGSKSLATSLIFQSDEKTLTDAEVNQIHLRICEALQKQCQAQIR